jgi:hypothetical protein
MIRLRLLFQYRGYRKGEVIQATPGLAAILVNQGIAVEDTQSEISVKAERSVAAQVNARTAAQ